MHPISNMFTQAQVDEAVLNAKKGLYNQEQVEIIINKQNIRMGYK